jgi:hypothetical protein
MFFSLHFLSLLLAFIMGLSDASREGERHDKKNVSISSGNVVGGGAKWQREKGKYAKSC